MAPWNEGADRSLGRSPTYRPLPEVFRDVQTVAGLCSARLNVNTCATFDLPLTFATAPHRA